MKALKRTDFRILVFLKIVLEVEKIALEPPLPCASLYHGHITQTGNRESLPILLCCLSSFMIQILNIKASERLFSCVVINYLKKYTDYRKCYLSIWYTAYWDSKRGICRITFSVCLLA